MKHVGECLSGENVEVKIAACKCLHSLSRSTKLLRTTIIDTEAWRPILEVSFPAQPSLSFSFLFHSPHLYSLSSSFLSSIFFSASFFLSLCFLHSFVFLFLSRLSFFFLLLFSPPLYSVKMLSLRDEECLTVATGVSANLLLAFSPSREVLLIITL